MAHAVAKSVCSFRLPVKRFFGLSVAVLLMAALAMPVEGSGGKVVRLKVDLSQQKALQRAVDKGHQPWRLDPAEVARSTVLSLDRQWRGGECRIVSESDRSGLVECRRTRDYTVSVKRLVKPKGIWTSVSVATR